MRLPNWFKIIWWIMLLIVLTIYLGERYHDLQIGRSIPMDVVVFLVWAGLLLTPLFNEIGLFGLTLKQQIDGLKKDVREQVQSLKSEIHSVVQINPNITIPIAPPDAQLPDIERQIQRVLDETMKRYGIAPQPDRLSKDVQVPSNDVLFLFEVRHSIESELRRIVRATTSAEAPLQLSRLIDILTKAAILEPELARVIGQVYAVCSPAVHGQEVSESKVKFVRDVAPGLIATLRRLRDIAELQIGNRR
jgi:hypothetical protein